MIVWIVAALIVFAIVVRLAATARHRDTEPMPRAATPPCSLGGGITVGEAPLAPVHIGALDDDLNLTYRDGAGNLTARRLTVRAADGHQTESGAIEIETISCYCHLRHMARTFRLDRAISVADEDGVVIDNIGAWIAARAKG